MRYSQKTRKVFCFSKNDVISNCSTDSPVAPILLKMPPIDAYINDEHIITGEFFCRMRPLCDIRNKPRKVFCLSKNDVTSNCSTDSTVSPIFLKLPPIDALFNDEYIIKR